MNADPRPEVTQLFAEARDGDPAARERLIDVVYDELRRIAGGFMKRERPDHTLQATALVNESLVRLLEGNALGNLRDRAYFFAAAAQAMRRVLIDHARTRGAAVRGGGMHKHALDGIVEAFAEQKLDVLALDHALDELQKLNERQYQVIMLRFFGGLSVSEVAEQLDVSVGTIEGDYRIARAWLFTRLGGAAS